MSLTTEVPPGDPMLASIQHRYLGCNQHFIARRLQLGGKAFGVLSDRKGAYLYLVQRARLGHVGVKPFLAELGRPGLGVFPGDVRADLDTIEHARLAPGLSRWRRR